ncbi:MAG: UDP-glucose 4-epimerase GalE [Gammaproteobacteria bacterium]|nr:UDP-glucose 4-epimerase GalE [Gammaproteobacteria bacterium]
MNILVCGGAGYIGSHMVKMLAKQGHNVVTFDNLSTGNRYAVKWGEFVRGDLLNTTDLFRLFQDRHFDLVMHFSARSLASESVQNPSLYYRCNVVGTYNLLEAMRKRGVNKYIFSSSAAIFGNPVAESINEEHPKAPINPYGQTKLMIEQLLHDCSKAYELNTVSLRYFNAAGADSEGELGEDHNPETHLIPNILKTAKEKNSPSLKIFGEDYNTPDGTCVRDYTHVEDICNAYLKAINYLDENKGAHTFNIGNGKGISVKQVLNAAQEVVGEDITHQITDRRHGDPDVLVADSSKAREQLGWKPKYTDIKEIISTTWNWIN